ncbi:hypothetical protein [Lentzea albidocapillata]|uniref:hypothetical protein n=1 Tax=Lentzea albidocapillata TaxID=40571 RepID=UPI0004C34B89|nr:hypothetical protein [Lentzea albidocapillata]
MADPLVYLPQHDQQSRGERIVQVSSRRRAASRCRSVAEYSFASTVSPSPRGSPRSSSSDS